MHICTGTVYKIYSECHMMILTQHAASKALECDEVAARTLRWYQRPMKRRYLIASLAFFGFCIIYMLRVNLSVAIVAMTANKTHILENGTTITVRERQCSQAGNYIARFSVVIETLVVYKGRLKGFGQVA